MMLRSLTFLAVALTCASPLRAQSVSPEPFKDGDTVCFLGDSITHGGHWHRFLELFYVSKFPDRKVEIVNCGIGGDRADGALKRLDWDVLVHQPTVIVIMLGMNDIGHSSYDSPTPTPQMLEAREASLKAYAANMDALLTAIRAKSKARVILVKPSPYDETATLPKPARKGANGALARCAEMCEELARKHKTALVDFHGPMTRLMSEGQKKDPAFALCGGDRVHPGSAGHLVMASLFARAQGLDLGERGPLPIMPGVQDPVLASILPASEIIGGSPTASATPRADAGAERATEMSALSLDRFNTSQFFRAIARMEVILRAAKVNLDDDTAVKTWIEERSKSFKPDSEAGKAWERQIEPYLLARKNAAEYTQKRVDLLKRMRALASATP